MKLLEKNHLTAPGIELKIKPEKELICLNSRISHGTWAPHGDNPWRIVFIVQISF